MSQFTTTLSERRLEIRRRIINLAGALHRADRPMPRLTWEQELLVTSLSSHVDALYEYAELEDQHVTKTELPGAEIVVVPELPPLTVVGRVLPPGEPPPPYVPEVAVVINEETCNTLLATGLWDFSQATLVMGYVLTRKPLPPVAEPTS